MKSLVAVGCLVASLSAFGQGYLAFANLGAGVSSPFHSDPGTLINGSGFSVEILVGTTGGYGGQTDSLAPLFTGNFSSGYFNGGSRPVPPFDIDGTGKTWVVIRAWDNQGGTIASYEQAQATGVLYLGSTAPFQVTPQTSAQVPANPLVGMPLINGTGNLLWIPEPSAWTLGLLGVGALVGCRRR